MSDENAVERTIEMVQGQVRDLERDLAEKKRMVNGLCKLIGREPIYANVESTHVGTVLRTDEFYGKALTSVARTVLERRDAAGLGAASVDALYSDLVRGGFQFDAKTEAFAKRSLAISLAKNSYLFHRLPNGDWGLVSWYDKIPKKSGWTKDEKPEPKEPSATDLDQPYPNDFAPIGDVGKGQAGSEEGTDAPLTAPEQKQSRKRRVASTEPSSSEGGSLAMSSTAE
jgi:hypothetical protein